MFEDELRLVINLGMTGRVVTTDAPRAAEMRHVAVRFELDDGRAILYDDIRRFGCLDLRDAEGWHRRDAELGLEPLSDAFTPEALWALTRGSTTPIRNFLLDQRRIAGVGNICERALFHGIQPAPFIGDAPRHRHARYPARPCFRNRSTIEARSATTVTFGESGGFVQWLRVYVARASRAWCAARRSDVVLTNRSAFYCPVCQR